MLRRFLSRLGRDPDFIIGTKPDPYIRRWWILPRNRWFNIYLHNILRSDDDRALHDHPWWNVSIVLKGGYVEVLPGPGGVTDPDTFRRIWRRPGSVLARRAGAAHRLEIHDRSAWTLFITGPRIREWGFYCPRGWVFWKRFVASDNPGAIGRGCGED